MNDHLIIRFFRWFCREDYVDDIEGDLLERYENEVEKNGITKAKITLGLEVLKLIRPSLIKPFSRLKKIRRYSMLQHNLKTGYRSLLRDKSHALVNILGLAVGMGVFLVIFQYIHFQMTFDTLHANHENTYRVVFKESNSNTEETYPDGLGYGFGLAAVNEIPEVINTVRKERVNRIATVTNPATQTAYYEQINDLFFVDASFFDVFDLSVLEGNKASFFNDRYNIVITEETAQKYFGESDPIGKTITISGPPSPGNYTVSGVVATPPLNSHLQFGFLMPMDNYINHGWGGAVKKNGDWTGFQVVTYLTLDEKADPALITQKLDALIERNTQGENIQKKVILQPISDVYLGSGDFSYPGHFNETGSMQNIIVFSIISILIVFIAWINYINLAISQSMKRAKEVGIRKTMGAYRKQLIGQFILESVIVNGFAAMLAIGIAFLLLPVLNGYIEKDLQMTLLRIPEFWAVFVGLVLFGALLAGVYPAFVLSNFKPIKALKNQITAPGSLGLRRSLIVFQFLTSLLLISSTYLIYKQVTFMKNQELTTDFEKILLINGPRVIPSNEIGMQRFAVFQQEMAKHSTIQSVAGSVFTPGDFWTGGKRRDLNTSPSEAPHCRGFYVTRNFEETYGLEFLAGSAFDGKMPDESMIILNESAMKLYGFESPEAAINQKLYEDDDEKFKTIVGVVKDFHWHSLHEDHVGYILSLYEGRMTENISIRLNTTDIAQSIEFIEEGFKSSFPGNPFEYSFADESFNQQYKSEQQFAKLFFFFSALAIFIGCVGLFALVSYSVNLKIKEIGIRKVLGAGVDSIVFLLSKDYLKLIVIAILVGMPLIWIGGQNWLDSFAHRIPLGFDVFMVPAIILLLVAIITVSQRTIRSATANPVESLRDE